MAERWTIKGRIVVDHILAELIEMRGSRDGLGGITVKVSARSKILTANFGDFLNRAGKILPDFDADKIRGVKQLLKPVASAARTAAVGT